MIAPSWEWIVLQYVWWAGPELPRKSPLLLTPSASVGWGRELEGKSEKLFGLRWMQFNKWRGRGKQVMQVPSLTTSWWMPNQSPSNSCLGKKKTPLFYCQVWGSVTWSVFWVISGQLSRLCPLPASCPANCWGQSNNQRMGKVWRDNWWSSNAGSLLKQSSLDHLTGDCDQTMYLQ